MKLLCVACLALAPSALPLAGEEERPTRTITVCKVELTPAGKAANFHGDIVYSIKTDAAGSVAELTKAGGRGRLGGFVREDKLSGCVRSWKLKPSTGYSVLFSVGTNSLPDSISITDSDGDSIKLLWP